MASSWTRGYSCVASSPKPELPAGVFASGAIARSSFVGALGFTLQREVVRTLDAADAHVIASIKLLTTCALRLAMLWMGAPAE